MAVLTIAAHVSNVRRGAARRGLPGVRPRGPRALPRGARAGAGRVSRSDVASTRARRRCPELSRPSLATSLAGRARARSNRSGSSEYSDRVTRDESAAHEMPRGASRRAAD